jgi:hypothetical protein
MAWFEEVKKNETEESGALLDELKSVIAKANATLENENDQFNKSFETWFESMKGQLSDDAAGNLQNEIDNVNDSISAISQGKVTTFPEDGSIVEKLDDGRKKTTSFDSEGNITEVLTSANGDVVWTQKTTFLSDGSIKEERIYG